MRRKVEVDGFRRDDGGVDEAQENEATNAVTRRGVSSRKVKEEKSNARRKDGFGEALADDVADVSADVANGRRDLINRLRDAYQEGLRDLLEVARGDVVVRRLAMRVEILEEVSAMDEGGAKSGLTMLNAGGF